MAPSKDTTHFYRKLFGPEKSWPPPPYTTYLQRPLQKKKKSTALMVETADGRKGFLRSDCSSQEPLIQNRVTEKRRLRRTHSCSSNSLPGHLELLDLQNSKPYLAIALGLPTTLSQLNLWLLSGRESVSDLNGSRQRKGGCGGLSYFITPASQASWNVTTRSSLETGSCPC